VKRENQIDSIRRTIAWFDQSHGKARKPKTKPNKISPMLWLTLKPTRHRHIVVFSRNDGCDLAHQQGQTRDRIRRSVRVVRRRGVG
jgi:hypothetical protein